MPFASLPGDDSSSSRGISLGINWEGLAGAELWSAGNSNQEAFGPGSATIRENAHALLAGLKTRWIQVMAGPAWAETITTTSSAFRHAQQGGIWVAKLALTAPVISTPNWALSFGAGRVQRLSAGAPVSRTTQIYRPATEGTPAGLSLDDSTGSGQGLDGSPSDLPMEAPPAHFLDHMTTIGLGLDFKL